MKTGWAAHPYRVRTEIHCAHKSEMSRLSSRRIADLVRDTGEHDGQSVKRSLRFMPGWVDEGILGKTRCLSSTWQQESRQRVMILMSTISVVQYRLYTPQTVYLRHCPCGGIGRHRRLKISRLYAMQVRFLPRAPFLIRAIHNQVSLAVLNVAVPGVWLWPFNRCLKRGE